VISKLKRLARARPGFSVRQVLGLLVTAAVAAAAVAASAAGRTAVALGLLGLLLVGVPAGVIHLSRRITGMNRATQDAIRDLRTTVEQLQRRVIASVEKERLAAGDRHLELTEALARTERLTGRGAELLLRAQNQEIEALFQLFRQVTPRAPMPAGGLLNPSDLLGLVTVAAGRRPGLTVQLGSGPATVWLAYALADAGGRLVAVEHDPMRAEQTRAALREHGLAAEVRQVPLAELSVEGRTVDWYDVDALDGLHEIGLLVVDGTVAPVPEAVAPALHVLGRRLAGAAAVVVDAPTPLVPRQASFGLTEHSRLAGRWTALAHPQSAVPTGK